MKSTKVIFYLDKFPVLSETFVLNQIAAFINSGVDVKIIAVNRSDSGMKHHWVKQYNLIERTIFIDSDGSKLSKILQLLPLGILDIFTLNFSSLKVLFTLGRKAYITTNKLAKYQNVPILCHFGPVGAVVANIKSLGNIESNPLYTVFHGYDLSQYDVLKEQKYNYQNLFKLGHKMLPISYFWKSKLISLGCDEKIISVSRMGVEVDDFAYVDRYSSGESPTTVEIICVCRFVEKKGVSDLLTSMAHLGPNYRLTLIGSGPLELEYKKIITDLKISNLVNMPGHLSSENVQKHLLKGSLFALPSVTAPCGDMEGIPVSLMEAMASGLLVLSTFHSGIPELITSEETGFLVDEAKPLQISAMIKHIFEELTPKQRNIISLNARNKIVNEFNVDKENSKLVKFLTENI